MKTIKFVLFFLLTICLSNQLFSQACGIYRIRYIGSVSSEKGIVTSLEFPTTQYLSGIETDRSKGFIETKPLGKEFELDITSHLGTPYSKEGVLIAYYKSKSPTFKMSVRIENESTGKNEEIFLEMDWDEIEVTAINDVSIGVLFEFRFREIVI